MRRLTRGMFIIVIVQLVPQIALRGTWQRLVEIRFSQVVNFRPRARTPRLPAVLAITTAPATAATASSRALFSLPVGCGGSAALILIAQLIWFFIVDIDGRWRGQILVNFDLLLVFRRGVRGRTTKCFIGINILTADVAARNIAAVGLAAARITRALAIAASASASPPTATAAATTFVAVGTRLAPFAFRFPTRTRRRWLVTNQVRLWRLARWSWCFIIFVDPVPCSSL